MDTTKARVEALEKKLKESEDGRKQDAAAASFRTYVLYIVQRVRIMKRASGGCGNCNIWNSTHLNDFGY